MLGEALKQLRLFHGLKQRDLANRLGVSVSYLSEIETGAKPNVPISIIEKYANTFNIPPSYIIMFSDELNKGESKIAINRKAAKKILKIMQWISDKKEFSADGQN